MSRSSLSGRGGAWFPSHGKRAISQQSVSAGAATSRYEFKVEGIGALSAEQRDGGWRAVIRRSIERWCGLRNILISNALRAGLNSCSVVIKVSRCTDIAKLRARCARTVLRMDISAVNGFASNGCGLWSPRGAAFAVGLVRAFATTTCQKDAPGTIPVAPVQSGFLAVASLSVGYVRSAVADP